MSLGHRALTLHSVDDIIVYVSDVAQVSVNLLFDRVQTVDAGVQLVGPGVLDVSVSLLRLRLLQQTQFVKTQSCRSGINIISNTEDG